jgi:predicted Fe-Mo cluster-binding NifX family protein
MKICFPIQTNEGLSSTVYNHFGSAPLFLVVDTATNDIAVINNRDQNHVQGACNPTKALDGRQVDAIVVGGIGAGALTKLNQMGIRVHRAGAPTVAENIPVLTSGKLPELTLQACCGGHSKDGACAH